MVELFHFVHLSAERMSWCGHAVGKLQQWNEKERESGRTCLVEKIQLLNVTTYISF